LALYKIHRATHARSRQITKSVKCASRGCENFETPVDFPYFN
jgi:hypothetical protein